MVKADPVTGDAILLINVSTTPSYIAAQEITTVEDSRRWLDDLPSLEIDTIGRSRVSPYSLSTRIKNVNEQLFYCPSTSP